MVYRRAILDSPAFGQFDKAEFPFTGPRQFLEIQVNVMVADIKAAIVVIGGVIRICGHLLFLPKARLVRAQLLRADIPWIPAVISAPLLTSGILAGGTGSSLIGA